MFQTMDEACCGLAERCEKLQKRKVYWFAVRGYCIEWVIVVVQMNKRDDLNNSDVDTLVLSRE